MNHEVFDDVFPYQFTEHFILSSDREDRATEQNETAVKNNAAQGGHEYKLGWRQYCGGLLCILGPRCTLDPQPSLSKPSSVLPTSLSVMTMKDVCDMGR